MPNFEYTGRSPQGRLDKGRMDAANADAVASGLMERGITPVTIKVVSRSSSGNVHIGKFLEEKIKPADLIMFSRQMYTITKSGIPLVRGIRGLAASIRHEKFQKTLHDVAGRLESGSSLSAALARHPETFNNLFVSMISVGESTGSLGSVFQQIAFYMERDEQTRKSIKSATRYPMFVVIALAIAISVVNIAVIPKFADMFAQFESALPLVTRILIGTSNIFVHYWWAMAFALGIGTVSTAWYLRTPQGALLWGKKRLKLPVVGDLMDRASMARYTRSFSLMLSAGVPINQALKLCGKAIDNPFLAMKIDQIRRGIEHGDSLLRTHVQSGMFSPLVIQMIAVGEESGKVEELLSDVADFYEREVAYDLSKLSARIEPILIVFMAVFVLILALGIFLPMWDLHSVQQSAL